MRRISEDIDLKMVSDAQAVAGMAADLGFAARYAAFVRDMVYGGGLRIRAGAFNGCRLGARIVCRTLTGFGSFNLQNDSAIGNSGFGSWKSRKPEVF